jgi:hypothetical protein
MLLRLLLAVAALTLAGCQSAIGTHITVDGPGEARATVTVRLDGEAADVLARDPANRAMLEDALADRLGRVPDRVEQGTAVEYRAAVPYARLEALAGWTGVRRLALAELDEDSPRVRLVADLVVPGELEAFLADLAGDAVDADAVLAAMRQLVDVELSATFPRRSSIVATVGEHWQSDGRSVTYRVPVAEATTATVSVTAELPAGPGVWSYLIAGAGAVVLAGVGVRQLRGR